MLRLVCPHRCTTGGHLALGDELPRTHAGLLDKAAITAYLSGRFASLPALDTAALALLISGRSDGNALFMVAVADQIAQAYAGGEPLDEGFWACLRACDS